jgi:hypothetical protein
MDFKPVTLKTVDSEIIPFGTLNPNFNGYNQISGSNLKFTVAQRDPNNGRPFSNLYSSFGLPAAPFEVNAWDTEWGNNSALTTIDNALNVVVVEIPKNTYGELIDGRTFRLKLPLVGGVSVNCYSSYYASYNASSDPSIEAERFGHTSALSLGLTPDIETPSTNVSFLFADTFGTPVNGGSWSAGYTTSSPPAGYPDATSFFSFTQDKVVAVPSDGGSGVDYPIGICYLDKGFIVLTSSALTQSIDWSASTASGCIPAGTGCTGTTVIYSAITQDYFAPSAADLTYYSFEKQWVLSVQCDAITDEFYLSSNPTAAPLNPIVTSNGEYDLSSVNKPVYITEIGLYDSNGDMLAIAKPDRPIEKYRNQTQTFDLKFRF